MHVALRIGNEEREWSSITEGWIRDQLERRRRDGQDVCVQLVVNGGEVDIRLSTPGCGSSAGGTRPARGIEVKILEIWRDLHMSSTEFSAGNVYAMVQRVHHMVS